MELPNIIQIITILIALLSLVTAYLGFRDKGKDKTDKDLSDRIKATVLSDAVSVKADALANAVNQKAQILSDAMALKAIEIKDLQIQYNIVASDIKVIQIQIDNLAKLADKADAALDTISDKIDDIRNKGNNV